MGTPNPSPSNVVDAYNKGRLIATGRFARSEPPLGAGAVTGQNTEEHDKNGTSGGTITTRSDFHSAVERGEVDAVSKLLGKGADATLLDSGGRSPLLLATQGGHLSVVRILLEFGAADASHIPPTGPNGKCALVKVAVRKEHLGILRVLIAHGADFDVMDSSGTTALQHAAMLGKARSIDVLVEHGAKVDSVDVDGCTALHWASIEGNGEAIVSLLGHGADIDAPDNAGRTPLHRACAVDDIHTTEAAELLLLWGADDMVTDNEGHIPEYYAKLRHDSSGHGGGGAKQRAQESLLQLLRTTPADRAWCRHGLVILCKARLGQGAVGTVLDRLVTLEEEELFEKSWALETDEDDDGDEEPQQERNRGLLEQHNGEEPSRKSQELREAREEQPQRAEEDSQASNMPQQNKENQTWIKAQHAQPAPQTWIKPQQKEEAEQREERNEAPSQNMRDDRQHNRGEPPGSPEFSQLYTLGKKIGEGAFSETFGATRRGDLRGSQSSCIVKRATQRAPSHQAKHGLAEEAQILRLLTHPSVVTVQEVFSHSPDYFYVVLEHLAGGPVFDRIVKKTRFRENDARHLCRILVGCIQHCHDLGIVHRDLRPEHLLLTSRDDNATIKLTGFDFARSLPRDGPDGRRGKRGPLAAESYVTAEYAAPEVLKSTPFGTGQALRQACRRKRRRTPKIPGFDSEEEDGSTSDDVICMGAEEGSVDEL